MTRMRPLLQHASRSLIAHLLPVAPQRASNTVLNRFATRLSSSRPSSCWRCQSGTSSVLDSRSQLSFHPTRTPPSRRQFSSSKNTTEVEEKSPVAPEPVPQTTPTPPVEETVSAQEGANPTPKPIPPREEDTIARVPAEDLPSHREGQRWDFSRRISEIMDELLPKLAVVTQKVNTYTGTDYSSIAALKREIQDQEKLVKARRRAIEEAKQALDAAHAQQASSQKEVVALLERKHSWSATDLERYMTLIRSEHVNDQAIREAKDAVLAAENSLEEARSRLEKRERAQYHEEQIWSDTIRRNSTWVTFGLMGLNILLLLVNLVILEPWRRKRMVREIKVALEEAQRPVAPAAPTGQFLAPIEAVVDKVEEPVDHATGDIVPQATETAPIDSDSRQKAVSPAPETTESVPIETTNPYHTANPATESSVPLTDDQTESIAAMDIEAEVNHDMTPLEKITSKLKELKSEEEISIRKKDLTATVCASVAVGWIFATVAFWIRNR